MRVAGLRRWTAWLVALAYVGLCAVGCGASSHSGSTKPSRAQSKGHANPAEDLWFRVTPTKLVRVDGRTGGVVRTFAVPAQRAIAAQLTVTPSGLIFSVVDSQTELSILDYGTGEIRDVATGFHAARLDSSSDPINDGDALALPYIDLAYGTGPVVVAGKAANRLATLIPFNQRLTSAERPLVAVRHLDHFTGTTIDGLAWYQSDGASPLVSVNLATRVVHTFATARYVGSEGYVAAGPAGLYQLLRNGSQLRVQKINPLTGAITQQIALPSVANDPRGAYAPSMLVSKSVAFADVEDVIIRIDLVKGDAQVVPCPQANRGGLFCDPFLTSAEDDTAAIFSTLVTSDGTPDAKAEQYAIVDAAGRFVRRSPTTAF